MRAFRVDRTAQLEFDDATAWYERQEPGLGYEFIDEVDRVLTRIETQVKFSPAADSEADRRCCARESVKRFPCTVVFFEIETRRKVMVWRGNVSPARWKSRL